MPPWQIEMFQFISKIERFNHCAKGTVYIGPGGGETGCKLPVYTWGSVQAGGYNSTLGLSSSIPFGVQTSTSEALPWLHLFYFLKKGEGKLCKITVDTLNLCVKGGVIGARLFLTVSLFCRDYSIWINFFELLLCTRWDLKQMCLSNSSVTVIVGEVAWI